MRRMCANCVSSIDAAAAAIGGVAGLRAWLGARVAMLASLRGMHACVGTLLLLAVVLVGAGVRHF
jgi:hypothetical protein